MNKSHSRSPFGIAIYFAIIFALGMYFTFASVQGDFGLFRRVQIDAEAIALVKERDDLIREVASIRNKAKRLSDEYLDLDLLDQQARDVLGLLRADEIVIR
jgi:cell division protein FtsB